jgi:hypothetical protein
MIPLYVVRNGRAYSMLVAFVKQLWQLRQRGQTTEIMWFFVPGLRTAGLPNLRGNSAAQAKVGTK